MEQAQGLVERAKQIPLWLTDARDLTGERLRLWDVFGAVDSSMLTPALSQVFAQVSWLPAPLPAAVWVIAIQDADRALPAQAAHWRSAPVGVLYVDATGRIKARGYALQAQMNQVFQGFHHAQYLGVLSSRGSFDLLHLFEGLFRKKDSRLQSQVRIFRKWCLEWRRKHWLVSPWMGE